MSARELRRFFDTHRSGSPGLVLASVYETLGSTYSKTGARMLITGDGQFQGMLSGGCLEGDLAERARRVADARLTERVTYDLRRDDEELWGLGVGCDGLMRIFLQPLTAADDYQPFTGILKVLDGERGGLAATVIESDDPAAPPGATVIGTGVSTQAFGFPGEVPGAIRAAVAASIAAGQSVTRKLALTTGPVTLLFAMLQPPPRILVLGGGLDAEPVVRMCAELGWRVVVQDHRPAYIEKGDFGGAERVVCEPAASLSDTVDLASIDAAVVMSHHLASDRVYLEQLAATDVAYVGLLGPRDRRRRLLEDLGDSAAALTGRLHGPAGLDIGGRGPTSIALSIVSQLHQVLMRADS